MCSPGVPAISTLNVRSMVLFSNGDPLWSLEDKKCNMLDFDKQNFGSFFDLRNGNESQKCLNLESSLHRFFLSLSFSVVCFCFLPRIMEKLLTLTLETLGSKEVARWLVWLQNTKEQG